MVLSTDRNIVTEATILTGLNLALSYEIASVSRLEERLSQSIVPEVREKLKRHLGQTREQQERLKELISMLGGQPLTEKGRLPIPEPPPSLKSMIKVVVLIAKGKFLNH